jgi:hypothetical protein
MVRQVRTTRISGEPPIKVDERDFMIIISGQTYSTIIDAAGELGVSAKTVREYIVKKIIPEPPIIQFGIRTVKHFPQDYMDAARKHLEKYRGGKDLSVKKSRQTALFENLQSTNSRIYKPHNGES